jgi:hypothetical protein
MPDSDAFRAWSHHGGGANLHLRGAATPDPATLTITVPVAQLTLSGDATPDDAILTLSAQAAELQLNGLATSDPATLVISPPPAHLLLIGAPTTDSAILTISPIPTRFVPFQIDSTGVTDVSAAIQAQIDACPDGYKLVFQHNGTYQCNTTLLVNNRNIIIDLNGSTIVQTNPVLYPVAEGTVAVSSDGTSVQGTSLTITPVSGTFPASTSSGSGPKLIVSDTNGAGTISQFTYSSKSGNTFSGLNDAYNTDTGTFHIGARVCIVDAVSAPGNNDAHRGVITFQGGTSSIFNGTLRGSSRQGGTNDLAYISSLEEQHGILAIAVTSLYVGNMTIEDLFGDCVYLQWASANPSVSTAVCTNVTFDTCTMQRNGRVCISPMAVVGLEVKSCLMTNIRRSFYDFEPPTATCKLINAHMHDNVYGSSRLLFMSGSGGVGFDDDVQNVLFERETTTTGGYNISMYDPRWVQAHGTHYRRGPFTFRNCVAAGQIGGGNNAQPGSYYAFEFHGVDGATVTGNTTPLQSRGSDPRLVRCINCTNISVSGNNLSPQPNDVSHQLRQQWEDDFQRADTTDLTANAPFATTAGYTTVAGGHLAVVSNMLVDNDSTGIVNVYKASVVMPGPKQSVEVDLGVITPNGVAADLLAFGGWVRLAASAETGYYLIAVNGGAANVAGNWHLELHKVLAGADTLIHTAAIGAVPAVGDSVQLIAQGSTLTANYNFVTLYQLTDTAIDGNNVGGWQVGLHMRRKQTTAAAIAAKIDTFKFVTFP